ncbi:MAG: shikimate kinase, partial [Bdellovibrio sp.]
MKLLLIGHRGVGKTQLLQRLLVISAQRRRAFKFYDLDREIQEQTALPPSEWLKKSETEFREIEKKILDSLRSRNEDSVIACGAGLDLRELSKARNEKWIWVRRVSDQRPRYLLDRPRLNPDLSLQKEWEMRFEVRERRYRDFCDLILDLPEGNLAPNEIEEAILWPGPQSVFAGLSLRTEHWRRDSSWMQMGYSFYELRDDIFSLQEIDQKMRLLPAEKLLLACRQRVQDLSWILRRGEEFRLDWASELGSPPKALRVAILSSHGAEPPKGEAMHFKWAPEVLSWDSLWAGLRWQAEDPERRSFLPRGSRWIWVRLFLKGRQQIQFVDDGWVGEVSQPRLFEWLATPWIPPRFGAVLGDPVELSYSPMEHFLFSRERGLPYFRIQCEAGELQGQWSQLQNMGCLFASVTSPLKKELVNVGFPTGGDLEPWGAAANTLWSGSSSEICNTDAPGFFEFIEDQGPSYFSGRDEPGRVVIWGGGGVLGFVLKAFPQALHFSTRYSGPLSAGIRAVVWAGSPDAEMPRLERHSL